jgi:DNA-binding NtrC family response regulator
MQHFLRQAAAFQGGVPEISADALDCLRAYRWPGNVRELRNVVERLALRNQPRIDVEALPPEVRFGSNAARTTPRVTLPAAPADGPTAATVLFDRLVQRRESFWAVVYEPFMARDLTRNDVREVIRLGLRHTLGNYKLLVTSFNMPPEDYKRFLNFLRKYECHVPFQLFRAAPARSGVPADPRGSVSV